MKRPATYNRIGLVISLILMCWTQTHLGTLPDPPQARNRQEIHAILNETAKQCHAHEAKALHIVLVADKKDHGPCEHDYPLWQQRWQTLLSSQGTGPVNLYGPPRACPVEKAIGSVTVTTARGWPSDAQFDAADAIVVFCYISWNERKLRQLQDYLDGGGAFVPIHSATWTKPKPSQDVATTTGCGGFTQYRHGPLTLSITDPNHPICLGLPQQIAFVDESYWPPTPQIPGKSMHVLATSREKINKHSPDTEAQPMFWTHTHGKGRVFGCVLGHYTWTFDDPYFRLLLLRGIAWSVRQSPYRFDPLSIHGIALKE